MTTDVVLKQIKDGETYANHNPHWWIRSQNGQLYVSYYCCDTCGNWWEDEYTAEKILKDYKRDEWSLLSV